MDRKHPLDALGGGEPFKGGQREVVKEPSGTQLKSDPALAVYTHFYFRLEEPQHDASEKAEGDVWIAHYNHVTHKYYSSYVKDANWQLRLDPRLGLNLAHRPGTPQQIEQAIDRVAAAAREAAAGIGRAGGADGTQDSSGGGGDKLKLPDDLVKWVWAVNDSSKQFVEFKSVERNQAPWGLAVFDLPGPGDYTITCSVIFKDRKFERRITLKVQEYLLAGIGDSFASGEGNPDNDGTVNPFDKRCALTTASMSQNSTPSMDENPTWVEPKAHRSLQSGQALAARALATTSGQTSVFQKTDLTSATLTRVIFIHFARSGAKMTSGLLEAQHRGNDYAGCGQIEELQRASQGRKIDALMISIGGNDLDFANVVEGLVTGDIHDFFSVSGVLTYLYDNVRMGPFVAGMSAISAIAGSSGMDEQARKQIEENLKKRLGVDLPAGQKGDLERLYESVFDSINRLDQAVGVGDVYINGYPPNPFGVNTANGLEYQYCGVFDNWDASLTPADSKMLERMGLFANELIKRKAEEFNWHYVDVAPGFRGHGYCAHGKETFFVGAEESCNRQGDFMGTLHPNSRGHQILAKALMGALEKHTFSRAPL